MYSRKEPSAELGSSDETQKTQSAGIAKKEEIMEGQGARAHNQIADATFSLCPRHTLRRMRGRRSKLPRRLRSPGGARLRPALTHLLES